MPNLKDASKSKLEIVSNIVIKNKENIKMIIANDKVSTDD